MSDILKDPSTPALVAAIKTNMFEYYEYLGRAPSTELHDSERLTWLLTGIPHPFVNAVLRTQVKRHQANEAVKETLALFRSKHVTKFSWWVEPGTQPSDLGKHLAASGLTYTKGGPGMAVDLAAVHETSMPAGLAIERVEDAATLRKWVQAAIRGFGLPDSSESACFDLFAGLGFDLPLCNYVGCLNGEPVATAQLFLAAGVGGIYWVATAPKARRQGIGAALTLAPLREALALGFRFGILHSSPMGLGVYRRLGFQEYCRMSHYYHTGETNQA